MLKPFLSVTVFSTALAVSLVGSVNASSQRFANNSLVYVKNNTTAGSESVTQSKNFIADNYVPSEKLTPGQRLIPGQYLIALNNNYKLILQYDGNLVLYNLQTSVAYWASNTDGIAVSYALMQNDGNFVIYNKSSQAVWSSNTANHPGALLKLKGTGALKINNADGTLLKQLAPPQQPTDPTDPTEPGCLQPCPIIP